MNNILKFEPEGWNKKSEEITRDNLKQIMENQTILQGVVNSCDSKYNLHLEFADGMHGIIPRNEIEAINIDSTGVPRDNLCTGKINKYVQFKIKDIDKDDNLILSRKDVQNEVLDWIKNNLKEGDKLSGIVKSIKPYGVFIEIGGGIVALNHIEDLSVARIKTPYERVDIGDVVDVIVKAVDRESGRVILSRKELLGTWEENVQNFQEGMCIPGIVREHEKNNNGTFIELTPNLVGMIEYNEKLQYGQRVEVFIKKIIPEKKKIKLLLI